MKYQLRCLDCDNRFQERAFENSCPACGGVLDVDVAEIATAAPDPAYKTILKYHKFLPIDDIKSVAEFEKAVPTPMIEASEIASFIGVQSVLLKDETVMATGTMKDREALLTINRLLINGIDGLVLGSSGNAGLAICHYASIVKGPKVHLFLPESSRQRMQEPLERLTDRRYVQVTYIAGSTDEAEDEGRLFAAGAGLPYGTGFQNYSRREGVKTFALEYLFEQPKRADWYFQGVAGALAVYSFYKVHMELGLKCPRLACIQPSACAPLVDAYLAHADSLEERFIPAEPVRVPEAPVLKSRRPKTVYPILKRILDEVNGVCEKVSAVEIEESLGLFYREHYFREKYRTTGVRVGLEAATALAGLVKLRAAGVVGASETVLVNVSGAAKPGDIPDSWWPPSELGPVPQLQRR